MENIKHNEIYHVWYRQNYEYLRIIQNFILIN